MKAIKSNHTIKYILAAVFAIVAVAAISVAGRYFTDYKKNVPEKFTLYITPETSYETLTDSLEGKLSDLKSFEKCFSRENPSGNIVPGHYVFQKDANNKNIVRSLKNGWQTPYRLTLSGNIRGLEKLAGILGRKMMYDSAAFIRYFNDPQTWDKYSLTKETFATLFIPNTYELYWSNTPEEFTERMNKENVRFWNEKRLQRAKELKMSKEEISTLASIVCEESNYNPELSTIAGVYMNRLKRGMKLEADPTVKFALNNPGLKRILYKHLEVDSPYNTYKIIGLPPGPITIPSVVGIDAVLNYKDHNYLYFCASEKLDGTHKFARTLSEHNRNARAYQAAINKLKIR